MANAIPCLHCQNILFQFSALRLPNSCHRQLDSVDVAKASLPAHYPTPCHAPSLPGPSRHKLIGLNPVINRLEKQLSMFVPPPSLPQSGAFWPQLSPLFSSPSVLPAHNSIMPSPPFPFWFPMLGERLTSLDSLAVAQVGKYSAGGLRSASNCFHELEWLFILRMPPAMLV